MKVNNFFGSSQNQMDLVIVPYTDRSFILTGDTKAYVENLKKMNGKWGPNKWTDKTTGARFSGWMFGNGRLEEVQAFIEGVNKGTVQPLAPEGKTLKAPAQAVVMPSIAALNLNTPISGVSPDYQTVTYSVKRPIVGSPVNITIGTGTDLTIMTHKIAHVVSSHNDNILDIVYISVSGAIEPSKVSLLKIVNGDWQVVGLLQEHRVVF
jgi:hypothetical protein